MASLLPDRPSSASYAESRYEEYEAHKASVPPSFPDFHLYESDPEKRSLSASEISKYSSLIADEALRARFIDFANRKPLTITTKISPLFHTMLPYPTVEGLGFMASKLSLKHSISLEVVHGFARLPERMILQSEPVWGVAVQPLLDSHVTPLLCIQRGGKLQVVILDSCNFKHNIRDSEEEEWSKSPEAHIGKIVTLLSSCPKVTEVIVLRHARQALITGCGVDALYVLKSAIVDLREREILDIRDIVPINEDNEFTLLPPQWAATAQINKASFDLSTPVPGSKGKTLGAVFAKYHVPLMADIAFAFRDRLGECSIRLMVRKEINTYVASKCYKYAIEAAKKSASSSLVAPE